MPEGEKKYSVAVYKTLKKKYGDKFTKTQEQFDIDLSSKEGYAESVYGIVKKVYGDKFTKTPEEFLLRVKKKDTSEQPSTESVPPLESPTQENVQGDMQDMSGQPIDPLFKQLPNQGESQDVNGLSAPAMDSNIQIDNTQTPQIAEQQLNLLKDEKTSFEQPVVKQKGADLPWVKRYTEGNIKNIKNEDGSISTHLLMAEIDEEGKWYVAPTIVEKDGKLEKLDVEEAKQYSFDNKTRMYFDNKEEALERMREIYPNMKNFLINICYDLYEQSKSEENL